MPHSFSYYSGFKLAKFESLEVNNDVWIVFSADYEQGKQEYFN